MRRVWRKTLLVDAMRRRTSPPFRSLRRFLRPILSGALFTLASPGHSAQLARRSAATPTIRIEDVSVDEGARGASSLAPVARVVEHGWAWGSEAKPSRDGSRLFVPLGYRGLAIYDVNDPKRPELLTTVDRAVLGGQAGAVAASGERAYVATPVEGSIVVLDVSTPNAPSVMARFASLPDILQIELRGRYLFVQAGSSVEYAGGVYVFDVSTTPPRAAGQYLSDLVDPGFYVSDSGIVFLARTPATDDDAARIDVIDMSAPASPRVLGQWASPVPGNVTDIDFRDGLLICSAYWGGLWVVDASDLSKMHLLARLDFDDPAAFAIAVRGAPPFIVLARGGPAVSYSAFLVYEMRNGCLSLRQEIPGTLPVHSVTGSGDQLLLAEKEPPFVPQPRLSLRSYAVWKDDTPATFTVSLSEPSAWPVTVDYATADGSAVAGGDYTASSGSIRFEPGETTAALTVAVRADADAEPDETFFVTLTNPVGAIVGKDRALGLIRDDDSAHRGSFFPLPLCRVGDEGVTDGDLRPRPTRPPEP